MQVKSWLSSMLNSIINSIRMRPNRTMRRRLNKRRASRASVALMAVAIFTPSFAAAGDGNCDGPLFIGLKYNAGNAPLSVTTGDFNGDGVTDLATANFYTDDVSVLLGVGDGTFAAEQRFTAGNGPWSVTTGDFNGDSVTDLATANVVSDDVSVLLGVGDGTFAAEQRFTAGDASRSVTTGDFNGDGVTDLATANFFTDDVSVLLNQCSGGSIVEVAPDSVTATRGDHVSGGIAELAESDNIGYSMRRRQSDIQSRTEFEVKSISPTETPTSFAFMLEGAVFAPSNVIQTVEFFDYDAQDWVEVGSEDAARSPSPDSVMVVAGTGDLSRFVEDGTMCIEARIHYQSDSPRQLFASNTDQAIWTIGQFADGGFPFCHTFFARPEKGPFLETNAANGNCCATKASPCMVCLKLPELCR